MPSGGRRIRQYPLATLNQQMNKTGHRLNPSEIHIAFNIDCNGLDIWIQCG